MDHLDLITAQSAESLNIVDEKDIPRFNNILRVQKVTSLEICFSPAEKMCIIGYTDFWDICWLSITDLQDAALNASIFRFLRQHHFYKCSSKYFIFKNRENEIKDWRSIFIRGKDSTSAKRDVLDYPYPTEIVFHTGYEDWAKYLALFLIDFFKKELQKCGHRLLFDSSYKHYLEKYKEILFQSNETHYYREVEPLVQMLKNEQFLHVSPDENIRKVYLDCIHQCDFLFERYMELVYCK